MNYQTIEVQIEGHVATVWLNRPNLLNSFNETSIAEITDAFRNLGTNDALRAIVLAARGSAFSAGADLNWMKKMSNYSMEDNCADAAQLAEMLHVIYVCPKPVVAKVQGDCYGGGMGLVAACDISISVETANFCLSEVRLGLIPGTISPYVIKAMGGQQARRYFLTAERFSAQEAQRIGFIHVVSTADGLDKASDAIVKSLVAASPNAVKEAKRLVRDIAGEPISDELIVDTANRIAAQRVSEEGREGVKAFLEKRKASWLD
ncbi:enoyl-CoA hydratase/isomerase family protein [soil metagenome]